MTAIKKTNSGIKKRTAKVIQLNVFNQQEQSKKYAEGFLAFLKGSLWADCNFTSSEEAELIRLIQDHLTSAKNEKQIFTDLIERVCLVKRYLARRPGRYIAKPQDWLNIHYPAGIRVTETWLSSVKEIRKNVPHYNEGISTLATAITKYLNTPNEKVIRHYRTLLQSQKQFGLLQTFFNTIIHIQIK